MMIGELKGPLNIYLLFLSDMPTTERRERGYLIFQAFISRFILEKEKKLTKKISRIFFFSNFRVAA